MSNELVDAIRRSIAARNENPQKMREWMEDFAERTEGANEYDAVQYDD